MTTQRIREGDYILKDSGRDESKGIVSHIHGVLFKVLTRNINSRIVSDLTSSFSADSR